MAVRPKPLIVGLSGGTASGKTTVSKAIISQLESASGVCELISLDMFYRPLSAAQQEQAKADAYNFDHPSTASPPRPFHLPACPHSASP